MELYGDVFMTEGEIGGQIQYKDGQPVIDGGLETFVYISLFSNGYWGNEITNEEAEVLTEGLDIYNRNKISAQTRIDVVDRAKKLLQSLLDIGLADIIEVDAFLHLESITLTIEIYKNKIVEKFKYLINWDNELNNPAISRL